MEEIGRRITCYLATFALVNSGFGLVIGLGMWAIGVPFAALWGCLAAMLRFIPYAGSAVAFVLLLVFSFANFPGWAHPLEVIALFAVVETALNSLGFRGHAHCKTQPDNRLFLSVNSWSDDCDAP
jgi:predicted PurR-regulated permease PerM